MLSTAGARLAASWDHSEQSRALLPGRHELARLSPRNLLERIGPTKFL